MIKRDEYPASVWGLIAWIFQKAFWKGCLIFCMGVLATFMWLNFSCDKAGGPRIENTEVKVKIGDKKQ